MRWLRHPVILAACALLLFTGILWLYYILLVQVFDQAFQAPQADQQHGTNAQHHGMHPEHVADGPDMWADLIPTWVQVVFSCMLVVATVIQLILWNRANKTAESALDEARQANDNASRAAAAAEASNGLAERNYRDMVEAERGRIYLSNMRADLSNDVVHFAMDNVGRAVLQVTSMDWQCYAFNQKDDAPIKDVLEFFERKPKHDLSYAMRPGDRISSDVPDKADKSRPRPDVFVYPIKTERAKTHYEVILSGDFRFIVAGIIDFQTMNRSYRYKYLVEFDPGAKCFGQISDPNFNRDVLVSGG